MSTSYDQGHPLLITRRDAVLGAAAAGVAILGKVDNAAALAALQPRLPYQGQYFGCSVNAGYLGNTRFTAYHSHRFRCEYTGSATKLRFKLPIASGYYTGNGGTLRLMLCADSSGVPNLNNVLAQSADIANPLSLGNWPLVTLRAPASLQSGVVYHIVYRQLTSGSGTISVDDLWSKAGCSPRSAYPAWGSTLASIMYSNGQWTVRPEATPIFEVHYGDGTIKGQGYTMGGAPNARPIDGSMLARQMFKVTDVNKTVRRLFLRVWRGSGGGGDLTVRLTNSSGDTLATGTVVRGSVVVSSETAGAAPIPWLTVTLSSSAVIAVGQTYYLVLTAPAGAGYRIETCYKGLWEGFREDKVWRNAFSQYSTDSGRTWRGWSLWGVDNRTDTDLPVLFEVQA